MYKLSSLLHHERSNMCTSWQVGNRHQALAMAAGTPFRLLLLFLVISQAVVCLNGAPITRLTRLVIHGPDHQVLPIPQPAKERSWEERLDGIDGRVAVELNDYPGSGANNRHTPRPQFGRCVDC